MFKGMKIYIAGPITGTTDYKERFAAAEDYLRSKGAIPMNPTRLSPGFEWDEYMQICCSMIDICEAAYFMDGYSESVGARQEFCYAAQKGKQLLHERIDPVWRDCIENN